MPSQGQPGVRIQALALKRYKPTLPPTTAKATRRASTCPVPHAVYLKSPRGAGGSSGRRFSGGTLPPGECFKETGGRGLCSTCILFIDFCHSESCDSNNQKKKKISFIEQLFRADPVRGGREAWVRHS